MRCDQLEWLVFDIKLLVGSADRQAKAKERKTDRQKGRETQTDKTGRF